MPVDCNITLNGQRYVNKASVSFGESVRFHCTCLDSVTVQWKRNGHNITTNAHYIIDATNDTLTIAAVRSSDNGNYTCISDSVSLTVRGTYITYNLYALFLFSP